MSRHEHKINERTELTAGFDHMGYYFVQKFVDDETVYSIATDPKSILKPHPDFPYDKQWHQHELAEIIIKEGGPKEWSDAIYLDLPF